MKVEYASSRREVAIGYWYSLRHNRKHLAFWLVNVLSMWGFAFLALRAVDWTALESTAAGGGAAMLEAAVLAVYPQLSFKPERRALAVAPSGITTKIGAQSRAYSWAQVASVQTNGDDVYIALRSLNAFIVPLRAFASRDQQREFVGKCRQWHQESGPPLV